MSISIRSAVHNDLESIKRIEDSSFKYPYSRAFLRYLIGNADVFLVAEVEEATGLSIGGYVCGVIERFGGKAFGHIYSIAVDPKFRRRGIGTTLMREILKRFAEMGVEAVYLECRRSNIVAQRFYRKFGFKMVSVIANYYNDGEDAIVFKKDLRN